MYKVFFADDEVAMRTGIRKNIDWENSDFILVGEAPDGELALPLIHEIMPDILITDVRMPFMDGIELSRRAKKAIPWIKIIILSGHDEFEYAKQAISIGVEEYLLKPITSEILMDTLKSVAERIDKEKDELKNIEKMIDDTKQFQTERLLSEFLYGKSDINAAIAEAEEFNMSIISDYYLIMIIELHSIEIKSYNLFQNVHAHVVSVLNGWENTIFFGQGLDRIICVLGGEGEDILVEEAYTCAHAIKYEIERNNDCFVSVSIGSVVSKIEDWPKSLAEANMARRYLNLINRNQIISMDDIRSSASIPLKEFKKLPTLDKLRYISKSDIPMLLEDCFDSVDGASAVSFIFKNYIFVDILMAVTQMLEELSADSIDVLEGYTDINTIISNSSIDELIKILTAILERTIDIRNSKTGSKYSDVISKAKEYIALNYAKQDISLNSVAKEVSMSPNHFSTIFSSETGETFISSLTKIRIEQAKILLKTTNLRTSDIAYEVGYNDTHYFNYVFKKNTGITPKEFRK